MRISQLFVRIDIRKNNLDGVHYESMICCGLRRDYVLGKNCSFLHAHITSEGGGDRNRQSLNISRQIGPTHIKIAHLEDFFVTTDHVKLVCVLGDSHT